LGTTANAEGNVQLSWEAPIGYVEFPDGYQFCLFEKEDDLITSESVARSQLERIIIASREKYSEEFAEITERAKKIYQEYKEELFGGKDMPEFTFEDFAELKANYYMIEDARNMYQDAILKAGYINNDHDSFGFKIDNSGGAPILKIIGMDFEYFEKDPERTAKIQQYRQTNDNSWPLEPEVHEHIPAGLAMAQDLGQKISEERIQNLMLIWGRRFGINVD
jgi:hypothetical protein